PGLKDEILRDVQTTLRSNLELLHFIIQQFSTKVFFLCDVSEVGKINDPLRYFQLTFLPLERRETVFDKLSKSVDKFNHSGSNFKEELTKTALKMAPELMNSLVSSSSPVEENPTAYYGSAVFKVIIHNTIL